jgi:hypothetical protein
VSGTTITKCRGDLIADAIEKMRAEGIERIEAQPDAAKTWGEAIPEINNRTLFPRANSWYMGDNVLGEKRE